MTAEELAARLNGTDLPVLIEKLGFNLDFIAKNVLSASAPMTVSQIAMLWMGMPNKHDRKRTRELFEALSRVGLMKRVAEDTYELA
jgi:hypothetical protein